MLQTDCRRGLHPAVSILCWLGLAILVARVDFRIVLAFAATLSLLVLITRSGPRARRVILRSRWLLLALLLAHGYTLPGVGIWPDAGVWAPTQEGLVSGGQQALRLLTILAGLAILLEQLAPRDLAYGLHILLQPVSWLGGDLRALTVRLYLVLDSVSSERTAPLRLDALSATTSPPGPAWLDLDARQPGWQDYAMLVLILLTLVWLG
jgi:energy-coupling factor transport system permease protein